MKFFNPNKPATILGRNQNAEQPELTGHVHPNYRHWNWFRPADLQADDKQ